MSQKSQVREFLASRRAKLTPSDVALPIGTGHRRVPGLRREEVALLAGISVDYYNRMERGDLSGVSPEILASLGRALRLNEDETKYLSDLARLANTPHRLKKSASSGAVALPSQLLHVVEAIADVPAFLLNGRRDILAANEIGTTLFSSVYEAMGPSVNLAEFTFLSPVARDFFPDWDAAAEVVVGHMRYAEGKNPGSAELRKLVSSLKQHSTAFEELWGRHDVAIQRTGTQVFRHPTAGDFDLVFEVFESLSTPDTTLVIFADIDESQTPTIRERLSS